MLLSRPLDVLATVSLTKTVIRIGGVFSLYSDKDHYYQQGIGRLLSLRLFPISLLINSLRICSNRSSCVVNLFVMVEGYVLLNTMVCLG